MPTLYQIITIALVSSFAILLIDRLGIRDNIVEKSKCSFISKLFSCDFCLSFWTNMLVCVLLIITTGNFALFVVPFLSTTVTRYLL